MATSAKRRGKGGGPKSSSAKRPREEGSNGGPFDQLCDDALLRIVSYTNDLRSLVRFTMCTSKSLRGRFDPKSTSRAQGECHNIWKGVFADLQMDPDQSRDGPLDYLRAINDRMALLKTLVGHDKRRKLPLRHYYFKPLPRPWKLDYDDGSSDGECAVEEAFSLMSSGTGEEYIIVNPDTYVLEVHSHLLEHTVCFDKSIQKKREGFKTLEETLDVAPGVETAAPTQVIKNVASEGGEFGYDHVPSARIGAEGSRIWMVRIVKEPPSRIMLGGPSTFTEVYVWTKGGPVWDPNGTSDPNGTFWALEDGCSQFRVKSMTRLPGEWDVDIDFKGNRLYGTIDEEAYNDIPERYRVEVPTVESAVFDIQMGSEFYGGQCLLGQNAFIWPMAQFQPSRVWITRRFWWAQRKAKLRFGTLITLMRLS